MKPRNNGFDSQQNCKLYNLEFVTEIFYACDFRSIYNNNDDDGGRTTEMTPNIFHLLSDKNERKRNLRQQLIKMISMRIICVHRHHDFPQSNRSIVCYANLDESFRWGKGNVFNASIEFECFIKRAIKILTIVIKTITEWSQLSIFFFSYFSLALSPSLSLLEN